MPLDSCCIVIFCRKGCATLPEGSEVFRASGEIECDQCGKKLREHIKYAYPTGLGHCVKGCDGRFYHL